MLREILYLRRSKVKLYSVIYIEDLANRRIGVLEKIPDDLSPETKRINRKVRPKTAVPNTKIPRYLQPIHGGAVKDDHYDIKTFYYRDLVIIRYLEDQRAQIIHEKQLINTFLLRNNDPYWRTIDYIQTNVKCQIGLGVPITIKFFADLTPDPHLPSRLLYDFNQFGEDAAITDELQYCLKL